MKKHINNYYWILLISIFSISVIIALYATVRYGFYVPPGDDVYVHLINTHAISDTNINSSLIGYPSGLYYLVIAISKIIGVSIIEVYRYLAPLLLPFSGLAIWFLASKLFNKNTALLAYVMYIFVCLQPLQTFIDGSLPNLYTAGILMPISYAFLIMALEKQKSISSWILFFFTSGLIFWSHHLTSLIYLATIILWLAAMLIDKILLRTKFKKLLKLIILFLLVTTISIVAFLNLEIFAGAREIFFRYFNIISTFPYLTFTNATHNDPWNSFLFGAFFSGLVYQGSLLGAFVALCKYRRMDNNKKLGILLLLVWFALYFVGSLTSYTGEPTRLARDLAMPASILTAYLIVLSFEYLQNKDVFVAKMFVIIVVVVSVFSMLIKVDLWLGNTSMVRFSRADELAYKYMLEHPDVAIKTVVLSKDLSWQVIPMIEKRDALFAGIGEERYYQDLPNAKCYLTGWYNQGAWPINFTNHDRTNSFLINPELKTKMEFADQYKVWYLLCRD